MKLKTKVKVFIETTEVGEYTVELKKGDSGNSILAIVPNDGTSGQWTWYLETLLSIDEYSVNTVSDKLSLDFRQNWYVIGMLEVYKEIINEVLGEIL